MTNKQFATLLAVLLILGGLILWQVISLRRDVASLQSDVTEVHNKLCPGIGGCSGL